MGVEETIEHLGAQTELTKTILDSSAASLEAREAQLNALVHRSAELRSRISALRVSLTGDWPSYADAEAILTARRRLDLYEDTESAFAILCEELSEISQQWRTAQADLKDLRSQELSNEDRYKLRRLRGRVSGSSRELQVQFAPLESMGISNDTYQPVHEGYDPAFESSASDVNRIIWAYLLSVQRVSGSLGLNHPGVVVFEEPRQQMADKISFRELLQRAAAIGGQVVFATSESEDELASMLNGLDPNILHYEGKNLKPLPA